MPWITEQEQIEWRIRNFESGIEQANARIVEIDEEIAPLAEERDGLGRDVQRWVDLTANLQATVDRLNAQEVSR